ncbi:MAG TPA: hypothetical protein VGU74_05310 [Gemmatimonadales bacterium]|nr:hypothetical protein [Gemmatimonadales bacterium]
MIHTKRHSWYRAAAGALAFVASTPAFAQNTPPRGVSYGLELAFSSGHADRGFLISDRPVVQPVSWVGWNGAAFSVWSSVPLTPNTDGTRPHIMELELGREHHWGKFTIEPAARMYFYHEALSRESDRSLEGWLFLSYDVGPFSLFTNQSLDVQTYPGAYFVDAGIESERHVSSPLDIGARLGAGFASARFNDAYAGVPQPALDRIRTDAWLTVSAKRLYISPRVEYSTIIDPAVRAAVPQPSYVLFRLTLGGEF